MLLGSTLYHLGLTAGFLGGARRFEQLCSKAPDDLRPALDRRRQGYGPAVQLSSVVDHAARLLGCPPPLPGAELFEFDDAIFQAVTPLLGAPEARACWLLGLTASRAVVELYLEIIAGDHAGRLTPDPRAEVHLQLGDLGARLLTASSPPWLPEPARALGPRVDQSIQHRLAAPLSPASCERSAGQILALVFEPVLLDALRSFSFAPPISAAPLDDAPPLSASPSSQPPPSAPHTLAPFAPRRSTTPPPPPSSAVASRSRIPVSVSPASAHAAAQASAAHAAARASAASRPSSAPAPLSHERVRVVVQYTRMRPDPDGGPPQPSGDSLRTWYMRVPREWAQQRRELRGQIERAVGRIFDATNQHLRGQRPEDATYLTPLAVVFEPLPALELAQRPWEQPAAPWELACCYEVAADGAPTPLRPAEF